MNIIVPAELRGEDGVGQAFKRLGSGIGAVGAAAAGMADNIQSQYDFNDFSELNQARAVEKEKATADFWTKEDGSTHDADGAPRDPMANYQALIKDIDDKYREKAVRINDRVANLLDKRGQIENYQYMMQGQNIQNKKLFDRTIKNTQNETDIAISNVIRSGGDFRHLEQQETLIKSNQQYLDGEGVSLGLNAAEFAKTEMARGYEASIRGILADPVYAPAFVKTLEAVPELKQKLFAKIPAEKWDDIEKLLAGKAGDNRRQNAYESLYAKHGGNFTAMNEDLSKPSVQRELGLGMEDSFYIKRQISDAQVDKDKADNVRWNQNATQVFLNLNKITPGEIDRMVQGGDLSYQLGEHFKTEKKQSLNEPSNPWSWLNAYNKIKDAAGDPTAMTKVRNEIFATGGISFSDKKSLIEMTEREKDKYESGLTKKGMDYIKAVVMPSQTMISAAKPIEAQRFLEAGVAYENALQNAQKNGEKITGEVVERISKEVAKTYSMTIYEQMDAVKKKTKEDKSKKAGVKPANAPKSNSPAFDVTVRKAPAPGTQLTDTSLAANYLRAANGDKKTARKLAKDDGWVF